MLHKLTILCQFCDACNFCTKNFSIDPRLKLRFVEICDCAINPPIVYRMSDLQCVSKQVGNYTQPIMEALKIK